MKTLEREAAGNGVAVETRRAGLQKKKPADRVPFLGPAKLLRALCAYSAMIADKLLDDFVLQAHAGNFRGAMGGPLKIVGHLLRGQMLLFSCCGHLMRKA